MQGHKKLMDELGRKSVHEFHAAQKLPLVIVLDEVRSMHNVGSVFRTADSFLIEAIYLCGYTPQPPHRDIQKTALGATESVIWKHVGSTLVAVEQLKNEDYVIISIEQVHGSISLADYAFDKTKKYAFIFGNEVNGVQQKVISLSDASIEIPQLGSKHSLNIAVSVGVVIWEFAKRFL